MIATAGALPARARRKQADRFSLPQIAEMK
jgi:hypothetical protein